MWLDPDPVILAMGPPDRAVRGGDYRAVLLTHNETSTGVTSRVPLIRQAGGGILVDNQPISSPYAILAIGPPHAMQDVFDRSPGLQRLRLLETSYGVGVSVSAGDGLTVPAGSVREINFAKQIGQ